MKSFFSAVSNRHSPGWRNAAFGTLLLAVAGCDAPVLDAGTGPGTVQRQELFRQLNELEASFGEVYPEDGLGSQSHEPRDWIRTGRIETQSDFENERVLRLVALQELAGMAAPEVNATDFTSFWEIHAAFRFAVETARFGQGEIDLVYSRPYVVDHLQSPHLGVIAFLSDLTPDDQPQNLAARRAEISGYKTLMQKVRRRLDLDAAAGITMPVSILDRMIAQIDASPFASEAAYTGWRTAWRAQLPRGVTPDPEKVNFVDRVRNELLAEIISFRERLVYLRELSEADGGRGSYKPANYAALINQMTSGDTDAASCLASATAGADLAADEFMTFVAQNWDSHIPFPELPEEERLTDGIPIPERPQDILSVWSTRAPLYPPEPEPAPEEGVDGIPQLQTTPAQPPVEAQPELPETFLALQRYIRIIEGELPGLSNPRMLPLELQASLPPETTIRAPQAEPAVTDEPLFSYSPNTSFDRYPVTISVARLEQEPMSLAVLALMKAYYPGHQMRLRMTYRREDLPYLSRTLSTLSFDLGWPYYALSTLDQRGAFDEAPQLKAALIWSELTLQAEAEAEAAYLSGTWSRSEALQSLQSRLSLTEAEAEARMTLFEAEPGFACAALQGISEFDSLKARARAVLGNRFNLRDFHDLLLVNGSRPLQLVEREVDDWIATGVQ